MMEGIKKSLTCCNDRIWSVDTENDGIFDMRFGYSLKRACSERLRIMKGQTAAAAEEEEGSAIK